MDGRCILVWHWLIHTVQIFQDVSEFIAQPFFQMETISVFFLSIFSRQGSFFYQVSLDHYRDSEFLVDAFTRYRMYLFLKKQYKDKFLVPCYDMDLVWHTHQVSTLHYTKDMNGILGFVLKHDDSVNDR